jgi:DNA-binding GntR family transcriptional regulator
MVATLSKSQLAYQAIRQSIESGRYTPGYRLVLAQLATELEMSVVPVREAIRRLEAEGLVTFVKNVGAQVALLAEGEYLHTMQTLSLIEGFATATAAPYLRAEDLARARAINQQLRECLDDFVPHRFTELNQSFHQVLFERCPNPQINDLVHRGWDRLAMLRDSIFGFIPGRARASVAEHERLLALIEAGAEAIEIELAVRAHRNATLDVYLARRATEGGRSDVAPSGGV